MTKRQRLTKFEFASLFLAQHGKCGCGCGRKLVAGQIDEEHSRPVALLGDPKPDSLWLRECHREKSKLDMPRIVKARHQAGGKGSQRYRREKHGPSLKSGRKLEGRGVPTKEERRKAKEWKAGRT